jgi:hypothetical protein
VTGRWLLGATGVAAGLYGGGMLLDDPFDDLVEIAVWLTAGVLLHDVVLAPLSVLAAEGSRRALPEAARGPVAAGAVVLVSVTLVAVPVLGRFGASPGNPTLLDRDYVAGWLSVAGLIALGVALGVLGTAWRRRHGAGPGR